LTLAPVKRYRSTIQLDNPIWAALTSGHATFARGGGLARRYPTAVSRLSGVADGSASAFADLRALVGPGEGVGLFSIAPYEVPDGWEVVLTRWIDQMVCETPLDADPSGIVELGQDDVPAMMALAQATQPGPFESRTLEMGRYVGIFDQARLVAMAGERLSLPDWTEISAVCTDPAYAGRGYAGRLMRMLMAHVFAQGRQPMLHVKTENGAKRLYEKLGFRVRREICLTILAQ
jgi:ribosomal protein S18 acetylase RimI-like enzyme